MHFKIKERLLGNLQLKWEKSICDVVQGEAFREEALDLSERVFSYYFKNRDVSHQPGRFCDPGTPQRLFPIHQPDRRLGSPTRSSGHPALFLTPHFHPVLLVLISGPTP